MTAVPYQDVAPAAGTEGSLPLLARNRQGRLLHGYLHKTSNSLCGIKGYASLIATCGGQTPETMSWAERILAEVELLERVYQSVQDIAFPRGGTPTGAGEITAVVTRSIREARRRFANLSVHGDGGGCGMLLLPEKDLELALAEVLANSAESYGRNAFSRPVQVRLNVLPGRGNRRVLVVADDGPGMIPELLSEAAAPFVTTKAGHLGIGLARVDTIMDMYGLAWSVTSQVARGTCVAMEVAQVPAEDEKSLTVERRS